MGRNYQLCLFVFSGTLNVLLMKQLNFMQAKCSDGKWRSFQHPVFQTLVMFLGEILCFGLFKILFFYLRRSGDDSVNSNILTRGGREFSSMLLLFPAFCDAAASLMLFTGLYLTYASSFQMLRGVCIIFVGICGSIYVNHILSARHWMSMLTIVCGVITLVSIDVQRVYYDHASLTNSDANSILTGDLLVIFSQIFHAAQFVYEEKHIKALDIPTLQANGWLGIYGFSIIAPLGILLNFMPVEMPFGNNSHGVFDDLSDIIPQLGSNLSLLLVLISFLLSAACYNCTALSIIKFSSASNRILADGLRILFIWVGVLMLEWEMGNIGALMAFLILTMGTIAYRNAIFLEWYRSVLASFARRRYVNLTVDNANNSNVVAISQPADEI